MAVIYHVNVVAKAFQIARDVGTDQHRPVFLLLHVFAKHVQDFVPAQHVHSRRRLIQYQKPRVMGKREQYMQLLPHAGRKILDFLIVRQVETIAFFQKSGTVELGIHTLQRGQQVPNRQIPAEPGIRQHDT